MNPQGRAPAIQRERGPYGKQDQCIHRHVNHWVVHDPLGILQVY